jgi:CheY-like chemotaxis protein
MDMPARVLVVDDDPQVRTVIRRILEQAGYDVEEAADGRMATTRYRARPADLVITDIYMPEKDGLEIVLELRALHPDVKVIAMSGGGRNLETRPLGSAAVFGARRTLLKPVLPAVLLSTVRDVLAESDQDPVPPGTR